MRLEKTLDLGNSRTCTVRELYVDMMRQAAAGLKSGSVEFDVAALITGDAAAEMSKLGDCIELKGCAVGELAFSDLEAIWQGFREVNQSFFKLLALFGLDLDVEIRRATSAISIGSAAASSSAGTSMSGDTAGGSSSPASNSAEPAPT